MIGWRMASSGMLCRVALVRTVASEELSASFSRVTTISELGTTLTVPSNWRTLRRNTKKYHLALLRSVRQLLGTASVVPSSPIVVILLKEAQSSSETSVLTSATRRNIPEYYILQSHGHENLSSYIALTGWTLSWIRNVSPVKYELGFYVPEDAILQPFLKTTMHCWLFCVLLCCAEAVCMSGWRLFQTVYRPQLTEETRQEPHYKGAGAGAQEGTISTYISRFINLPLSFKQQNFWFCTQKTELLSQLHVVYLHRR
jgi:hypothetical protein